MKIAGAVLLVELFVLPLPVVAGHDLSRTYKRPIEAVYQAAVNTARARGYTVLASSPAEHLLTVRLKPGYRGPVGDLTVSFVTEKNKTLLSLQVTNQPILGHPGDKEAKKFLKALDEMVTHPD